MNKPLLYLLSIVLLLTSGLRAAESSFAQDVDVKPLETLSIQHNQTLKTLDSYARQVLSAITGKTRLDGHSALFTMLDMAYRPHLYLDRNIVRIKNVPLRKDFGELEIIDSAEKQRILEEGTISLNFYARPEVQEMLARMQSTAAYKFDAVNQLHDAAQSLSALVSANMSHWPILPPGTSEPTDHIWLTFMHVRGAVPGMNELLVSSGMQAPPPPPGVYKDRAQELQRIMQALTALADGWRAQDAALVNQGIGELATVIPTLNSERYPSAAKRKAEVIYNRLAKLTLPGAAFYFVAFVCFLISARSGVGSLRLWGLRLLLIAFLIHTAGIGIRWWLVEKSVGNWFEAIPIKNQFESVMFSAWFGALVGIVLEMRKSKAIFGAAASFVGWLSLTAIFATPFVFKREIGGEIGQVAGVLMSYWLYIHVTMVVASYALIGMSFCLGLWWLVRYYCEYGTIARLSARQLSADAAERETNAPRGGRSATAGDEYGPVSGGGAVSLGFWQTLALMAFMPQPKVRAQLAARNAEAQSSADRAERTRSFLATLDLCNLVVLQLAFWLLGVGIILGAIWADQSWGRPWGWDPKETFALVTWIVYLIVVHVRVVTADKAYWTSVLSILGFGVMLFNWIGVNFFLVGLHSYA